MTQRLPSSRGRFGPPRTLVAAASVPLLVGALLVAGTGTAGAGTTALPAKAAPADKGPTAPSDAVANFKAGRYIVVMGAKPVATYSGDVRGYARTKPAKGAKINPRSTAVERWSDRIEREQTQVAKANRVQIKQRYTIALNGFAAKLSAKQAASLARNDKVLTVAPDVAHKVDYSTDDYLELSGKKGAWKTNFGGRKNAGKGTVVGVIDSGYYPKNKFFKGKKVKPLEGSPKVGAPYRDSSGEIAMLKADGSTFTGACQAGEKFKASTCNSKVLAARSFSDAFVESVPADKRDPKEVLSPLDTDSHGSHTASTAAGNSGVKMRIAGKKIGKGTGVAPSAKLAIYKICFNDTDPDTGGCYTSSSVEAIDQAVLDGVDVLNYSISGNTNSVIDPVALAFLSAASAGVFVAASAGNSGPAAGTVNHAAPWLTTVAASTFSAGPQGTVVFPDGTKFRGSAWKAGVPATPAFLAETRGVAGADPTALRLCGKNTLDPAKVKGNIVVCDRGTYARTAKGDEVARAGGVGMVLVNTTDGSEDADVQAVPTIGINVPSSLEVRAKIAADPGIKVALADGDTTGKPAAPQPTTAGFSSRGPTAAVEGDLLKPDITAPGVNVPAAVSPIGDDGENFGLLSGTSMASPHIAGFGALMLAKYPTWSPMAVKSAIMTTAVDVKTSSGAVDPDVLARGAGEVSPTGMTDPGLVYDSGVEDWLGFLEGAGYDLGIDGVKAIPTRDLNVPSFAVGSLVGKQTLTRTLTAETPGIYRATAAVPGVDVKVTPSVLYFGAKGAKKTFKVTFDARTAKPETYAFGKLTWSGSKKSVSSPIAVRPTTIKAPEEVSLTSATGDGSGSYPVTSGKNGGIDLALTGFAKGDEVDGTLTAGPRTVADSASTKVQKVTVAKGTSLLKLAVVSKEDKADFDLYATGPDGADYVAATASGSEAITLTDPKPGVYTVSANLYAAPGGSAPFIGQAFAVAGDEGNGTVSPDPLRLSNGQSGKVTVGWKGLTKGNYLGVVKYDGVVSTLVDVGIEQSKAGDISADVLPAEKNPLQGVEKQPVQPKTGGSAR